MVVRQVQVDDAGLPAVEIIIEGNALAAKVRVRCRSCVKCMASARVVKARNTTRGTIAIATGGLSELTLAFTQKCRACGHAESIHKRASKSKRPAIKPAPRPPAKDKAVVKKTWSTSTVADSGIHGAGGGWIAAERLAAAALRGYGFIDAVVTPSGNDGGFDVIGTGIVAQVKYRSRATGRPELQQLVGANTRFATAAFFSRNGYSTQAIDFADSVGMALFQIELPRTIAPVNRAAFRLVRG
jgi:hypothetical protein